MTMKSSNKSNSKSVEEFMPGESKHSNYENSKIKKISDLLVFMFLKFLRIFSAILKYHYLSPNSKLMSFLFYCKVFNFTFDL